MARKLSAAEALAQVAPAPKPRKIDVILAGMKPADREVMTEALRSDLSPKRVVGALALMGHSVGDQSVVRWRKENPNEG